MFLRMHLTTTLSTVATSLKPMIPLVLSLMAFEPGADDENGTITGVEDDFDRD